MAIRYNAALSAGKPSLTLCLLPFAEHSYRARICPGAHARDVPSASSISLHRQTQYLPDHDRREGNKRVWEPFDVKAATSSFKVDGTEKYSADSLQGGKEAKTSSSGLEQSPPRSLPTVCVGSHTWQSWLEGGSHRILPLLALTFLSPTVPSCLAASFSPQVWSNVGGCASWVPGKEPSFLLGRLLPLAHDSMTSLC